MNEDKVSIIVPVYKVEKYLNKCVNSIVNQTYANTEVILTDDGSPDSCAEMCDAWAKNDNRIIVIHKNNGGLSDARNMGMDISLGEFTGFVDSDDYIHPEMYSKLYRSIKETGSNIAECNADRVWEKGKGAVPLKRTNENRIFEGNDALGALIESNNIAITVWNKLYKTSCIGNLRFEKGKIHEDEFFTWQALARARRVSVIGDALYYYLQRDDSIIGSGYSGNIMSVIEAKVMRHNYVKENMPELLDSDSYNLLYSCYYAGCNIVKYETRSNRNTMFAELNKVLRKCTFSHEYIKNLPITKRIRMMFIKNCLLFVCKTDTFLRLN